MFLRTLKKFYITPPADQLTVLPLIAHLDLCPQPSDTDCYRCSLKNRSRFLSKSDLSKLLPSITLGQCPDTIAGYSQLFAPFGCPSAIIKRLLPRANIILLPQGFLESYPLREKLSKIIKGSLASGFRRSHRFTVIDEAHNFGPMTEAALSVNQLLHVQSIGAFPVVQSLLKLCYKPLGQVDRPCSADSAHVVQIDHFLHQRGIHNHLSPDDLESLHAVRAFLVGKGQYWVHNEEGLVQLNPYPKDIFDFIHKHFDRVILMSATFCRIQFFKYFYGIHGSKYPYRSYSVSKTAQQHRQLFPVAFVSSRISSTPKNRTPSFFTEITDIISRTALMADDHTLIFVPSYEVLDTLFPLLIKCLSMHMSIFREPAKGRVPFLKTLIHGDRSVIVAVYGGKFTEGIEILDPETGRSRIRCVVLVGLPFPAPTPEFLLLKHLYRQKWKFLHFVNWILIERPLYNIVMQCLGRAIRSEQDHAVALILDYRILFHQFIPFLSRYSSKADLLNGLQYRFAIINKDGKSRIKDSYNNVV